jgi:hypothetical protein
MQNFLQDLVCSFHLPICLRVIHGTNLSWVPRASWKLVQNHLVCNIPKNKLIIKVYMHLGIYFRFWQIRIWKIIAIYGNSNFGIYYL